MNLNQAEPLGFLLETDVGSQATVQRDAIVDVVDLTYVVKRESFEVLDLRITVLNLSRTSTRCR